MPKIFYKFNGNLAVISLLLLLTGSMRAQSPASVAGTSSNLLLRYGPYTRVVAFSGSFTAVANDESALFYNPGGLTNLDKGMLSLNHAVWFEDIRIDNFLAGYNLSDRVTVGAGFTYMWMPDLKGKDNFGRNTGSISVSSSIIQAGAAYEWIKGFSSGFGIKYFQDNLADFSASGVAFDIGLHFKTFLQGLTGGVAVQNLGGKIKYDQEKQDIPMVIRGGLAYKFFTPDLLLTADVLKARDSDIIISFGSEFTFLNLFSLRVGNRFLQNELLAPSFGAGFWIQNQYLINYTFSTFTDLGGTHRIGFSFHFDTPATKSLRKKLSLPVKPAVLVPPRNLDVKISEGILLINWDIVPGARYNVYAKHSSKDAWQKLNGEALIKNIMKFKKPGTKGTYLFRVTSVIDGRESPYSKETSIDIE